LKYSQIKPVKYFSCDANLYGIFLFQVLGAVSQFAPLPSPFACTSCCCVCCTGDISSLPPVCVDCIFSKVVVWGHAHFGYFIVDTTYKFPCHSCCRGHSDINEIVRILSSWTFFSYKSLLHIAAPTLFCLPTILVLCWYISINHIIKSIWIFKYSCLL
jgi:hypothetical protein